MTSSEIVSIAIGAALGAWIRWGLSLALNGLFPKLPIGTLVANCTGGLLIGLSVTIFGHYENLAPELRSLFITGFLGALTTFSTFSVESVTLLVRGQFPWFVAHVVAHLLGSLSMTLVGIVIMHAIFKEPLLGQKS